MRIGIGTKLGPYELTQAIGAGGFGQVFKARDSRLNRFVAIKVLPEHLSQSPELKARFELEAQTLASLSHPHICPIFDVGEQDGTDFIVMEYLEGITLAQRLEKGALPLDEALKIAIDVADALDKAHRQGLFHRDVKPANVMLTKSGSKLLDFGLVKLKQSATATSLADLPTGAGLTAHGTILGTLQYMSPEQLEAQETDARADIFSFGAVLYEMLTGKKAFEAGSQASMIAAIMEREPASVSTLQPTTPPLLDHLVRGCIAKDPAERWQTAHDVTKQLHWIAQAGSSAAPTESRQTASRSKAWLVAAAALAVIAAVVITAYVFRETHDDQASHSGSALARLMITLPEAQALEKSRFPSLALSPDGKLLVYAAAANGGRTNLYLRPLDEITARPIPATEGATTPFFSPDGRWLAFYANGLLKKVSVAGGVPLNICEAAPVWSATWGENEQIVFATTVDSSGLWLVSANGGEPAQITTLKSGETQHGYPQLLPGGTQLLFSIRRDNAWRLALLGLKDRNSRLLGNGRVVGEGAQYLTTGHIVYAQSGGLVATPFDLSGSNFDQPPVPLLEHLETSRFGGAFFAVAANAGTLVYAPAGTAVAERTLLRVDRDGRAAPLVEAHASYEQPSFSPDGRKLAVTIGSMTGTDIWIIDLDRTTRVRFTAGDSSAFPVWDPKGARLAFQSTAPGPWNLFSKSLDGGDLQPLLKGTDALSTSSVANLGANLLPGTLPTLSGAGPQFPTSWSQDGSVAFHERKPSGERDIWVVTPGSDPVPFLLTAFDERLPRFSPDGKWLAYVSDESGRSDVYVQPFPGPGSKWLISTDGGSDPVWSRDGRELFYRHGDQLMVAPIVSRADFSAGRPRKLFEIRFDTSNNGPNYDVSPDGKWFVMPRSNQGAAPEELHLVLNWLAEVTNRAAGRPSQ